MKKVFIGIPTQKDLPWEFVLSLLNLMVYNTHQEDKIAFKVGIAQRTFRNLAREQLAQEAWEAGADYLFYLDDDMTFPPDVIQRLMAHDVPVVSALAFTRQKPHKPCLLLMKPTMTNKGLKEEYLIWEDYPKDQLVKVAASGLACTLIKREVLERIEKPICTSKEAAGEDIEFHRKTRAAGFDTYVDTATKIGHLSDRYEVTEKDWLENYNEFKEAHDKK